MGHRLIKEGGRLLGDLGTSKHRMQARIGGHPAGHVRVDVLLIPSVPSGVQGAAQDYGHVGVAADS